MRGSRLRGRLAGVLAGALTAAVLLAGCVGIPMNGSVVAGGEINEDVDPPVGFLPSGPRDGATQQEILLDFIQAATSPGNDYTIARQFLADDIRTKWNPDARVTIRSSGSAPTTVSEAELDYTITTSARVDSDGRYYQDDELSSQTLEFGFVKEGDEWRISQVEDGIVLSEDNFDVVFSSYALYFFDPSYTFLVPDVRWFPNSSRIAERISASLVKGQADWLAQGVLVSEFPSGTTLGADGVSVVSGVATIDLSGEARDASNTQRERMQQQLAASLADVRTVSKVVITVAGVPLPINDSNSGVATRQPKVNTNPLARVGDEFGFVSGSNVDPLSPPQLGAAVIEINAGAAVLSAGGATVAARAKDGVYVIRASGDGPVRIDTRTGLADPTIDGLGFLWSAQEKSTSSITTFSLSGTEHSLDTSTLPTGARIVSMDLSRDGSRLLLYLMVGGAPRLVVAGVIRGQDNVPDRLGDLVELPIDSLTPIDATWVSDSVVATLSRSGADAIVTALVIGGPSTVLGRVAGGKTIAGGNGGTDGIRVLTNDGDLFKPRGNGWQQTGINASFLATQQ